MDILYDASVVPTTDNKIPFRQGDFSNVIEALEYAAQTNAGFNFFNVSGALIDKITYQSLQTESVNVARHLIKLGFKPHDRVIMIAETSRQFLILFFACQYASLIACPIPFFTAQSSLEAYSKRLQLLAKKSTSVAIFAPDYATQILAPLPPLENFPIYDFQAVINKAKEDFSVNESRRLHPFTAKDPAFIQYSSGSTASPKGVQLTQSALSASIYTTFKCAIDLQANDRTLSWLPYHHSFGLIGSVLTSVYGQRTVDFISPETFVQNPLLWLKLATVYRTNILLSPFFGYQLALKAYLEQEHKPQLDLSSIRVAIVSADMININSLEYFSHVFAPSGYQHKVFFPCYGLTETTMSVSGSDVDKEPYAEVLQGSLSQKKIASCGRVLPGCQIKIIDPITKKPVPDKMIGQIWVNGDVVLKSYIDSEHEMIIDNEGFLYTGDIGYFNNEHLFITGREKDVIIIHGKNIWSLDVEWTIQEEIPEFKGNSIAAVSIMSDDLEETLLIVVSLSGITLELTPELLINSIKKIISKASGVVPEVVLINDPLPLTASGKLARTKIKQDFLEQKLSII